MKIKTTLMILLLSISTLNSNPSHAVDMNDAGWYLSLDMQAIKQSPFNQFIENDNNEIIDLASHLFGEEFHKQITHITVYGDTDGLNDISLLIRGNFTEQAKDAFFDHSNLQIVSSIKAYNRHNIHEWNFDENTEIVNFPKKASLVKNGESFKLYVSEIEPDLIMVSRDIDDVKSWLSGLLNFKELNQNGLFSVIVNLQEALARGGMKLDQGEQSFHSDLLKKVSQVSFSLIEDGPNLILEAALSTNDEATATQVQQVLNGLIALNALSNINENNELHALLMNNLKIDKNGSNIIISTFGPSELIAELKDHFH